MYPGSLHQIQEDVPVQVNHAQSSLYSDKSARANLYFPAIIKIFFPNTPQKGSRFKVGVEGSRRRREVVAFMFAKRPQAFASVLKRLQASLSVGECRASSGVANRRETQNCRHFLRFASQKCQQSQGSDRVVIANRRTVVTFGLVSGLRISKVPTVTGIGGVVVAKRRTVVTFGLVSGLRISKVPTVAGIGGVVVAKRRTVVTFYVSHLKSVNSQRDRGGSSSRNAELSRLFASQQCQQSQGSGGSSLRNAELSSLLKSSCIFASQQCQQSQGSGGSSSRNAELSSLLALPLDRGEERGEKRETRGERGKEREKGRERRGEER